ncbi:MAG TPA: TlpA disulfide reductase family protein, partial [Bellilinea sp.]|nr:TlpA disulfide reductase family protein [Bellilinea sp.]
MQSRLGKKTIHVLPIIMVAGVVFGLLINWQLNRNQAGGQDDGLPTPSPTSSSTQQYFFTVPAQPTEDTLSLDLGAPEVGTIAPDFELNNAVGDPIRLSDLRSSVVVINFWASWCDPCREEMSILQKLSDEYANKGLVVLGINTTYTDSRDDAISFIEELDLTFPMVFDDTGAVGEKLYKVFGLPTSYWIDEAGYIQSF